MKLVFLSDTHSNDVKVPDGDILIFCGDITCFLDPSANYRELSYSLEWFRKLPHKNKIFVAGNHDTSICHFTDVRDKIRAGQEFIYLEDESTVINGIKFYGSPYTPLFGPWSFMYPKGKKAKLKWKSIPEDIDILVTHGPPYNILDQNLEGYRCGCKYLAKRVEEVKPSIHAFGHIHPGYGVTQKEYTLFVNCSICSDNPQVVTNEPIVIDWPLSLGMIYG